MKIPQELVEHIHTSWNFISETAMFTAWGPEEMRERWRHRALNDIRSQGTINHLFPCIDNALLASKALNMRNIPANVTLYTSRSELDAYRAGQRRVIHTDAIIEMPEGRFGIGCADISVLTLVGANHEQTIFDAWFIGQQDEQHPEKPKVERWERTPYLSVSNTTIFDHPNSPILHFLRSPHNKVQPPYNLTLDELQNSRTVPGKPHIFDSNAQDYSPQANNEWSQKFTKLVEKEIPGLRPWTYI